MRATAKPQLALAFTLRPGQDTPAEKIAGNKVCWEMRLGVCIFLLLLLILFSK